MNSRYFEHDADVGVIGRGPTIEKAFESAAQAVFALVTDLDAIQANISIDFDFEEDDLELALVTWLNMLLGKARELSLIFCHFHIQRKGNHWYAEAKGENWRTDLEHGVEVKGATLTMLSVKQSDSQWEVRCVVDV